jgi:hypothetical protein
MFRLVSMAESDKADSKRSEAKGSDSKRSAAATATTEQLWEIVLAESRRHRLEIPQSCESQLRQFVEHGAAALGDAASPDETQEAQENLRRFIRLMVKDATKMGSTQLHGGTFADAKSRLCPLFPFC